MDQPSVVIVGAGISGLALAHALRKRGVDPLVLESEPHPGGKLGTDRVEGFRCEWGPQSFSYRDPAAEALLDEVGLRARLVPATDAARRRLVLADGRLRAIPGSPLALLCSDLLPASAKARLLLDLLLPRGPAARGGDETVSAFAYRRLGPAAAERLFFPLVSGLYAGDPGQISLPSAFPTLARVERDHRSILLGARQSLADAAGRGPPIATFLDGLGELPRALASRLGQRLRLGRAVTEVRAERGGFTLRHHGPDGAESLRSGCVVLATPAHAAARIVEPLDAPLSESLAAIPYLPVALAFLGYRREDLGLPPDAYGFFVPPSEPSRLLGGVFTSTVFPGHAPEGSVLIAARVGGARTPELARLPEAELLALVHGELAPLLQARLPPAFFRLMRHAQALPHYTLGHRDRLAAVERGERSHPGLFFTGNAYRGLGIADCIRNAEPMAERILAFRAVRPSTTERTAH